MTEIPTCKQIFNEEFGFAVHRTASDSWRHGCRVSEVYSRKSDGTYWLAEFQLSTDGEHNGLREGEATITQVKPEVKEVTVYVPVHGG